MKNIGTIFRKEFYRVISDRRLIFTAILLPGLAIYLMYSFMGDALGGELEDVQNHEVIVYVENMPAEFENFVIAADTNVVFEDYQVSEHDQLKDEILNGNIDLIIRFPENFVAEIENQDIPDVLTYYNPGEKYSSFAYDSFSGLLNAYKQAKAYALFGDAYSIFTLDTDNAEHIIVNEDKATGQGFAMLLPMLIIMFLFSGAMSIGPDSIAGEKERGTIATLLITPVKRSEIAIGKVLSLSVISLFSATSSFVGIVFSLPKLMQSDGMSIDIYGASDFIMLFSVLLATVLVIVGIISVISAYAKTIKEASMLILPFYFGTIVLGMSTMFGGEAASSVWVYMTPLYSSINIIISILTFEVVAVNFFATIVSSLVYVSILIFVLNKLFQSEKIMFSK
jgi:sodium transport system permease protein